MHLKQPDWLAHRLTVGGPADAVSDFVRAAGGSGTVPWHHDVDRLAEDWFHLMMAPPPHRRSVSAAGARVLAGQLRDAMWESHARTTARMDARRSPFDLHALMPVPSGMLRRGADAPESLDWLQRHWGTTWPLRRVERLGTPDAASFACSFWSADWTPWPVISALRTRFAVLSIEVVPLYAP
jgi:hypothetical protein